MYYSLNVDWPPNLFLPSLPSTITHRMCIGFLNFFAFEFSVQSTLCWTLYSPEFRISQIYNQNTAIKIPNICRETNKIRRYVFVLFGFVVILIIINGAFSLFLLVFILSKVKFPFSVDRGGKKIYGLGESFLIQKQKERNVGDRSRGRPEGSLFNIYYTEV